MKFSESEKGSNRTGDPPIPTDVTKGVPPKDFRNGDAHLNGDSHLVNGNHPSDPLATSSVKTKDSLMMDGPSQQPPPEIQHISSGYVSFSTLIERLVQETFNDLGNVITEMAEMPAEQRRPNGVLNHNHPQTNGIVGGKSEANVQKKLLMLNFTQNWRPKFIKILVLSQWARQAESVSRVIDLKNWEDTERMEYDGAVTAMGELKRGMAAIKEPSPDIKTALEVLLLGKATWLPDFDYLTAEPLSTQHILDTLRRISTVLSIRLNLHEKIPAVFRDFQISSGRATFRVPQEFEVDLSVAKEDPLSQLFFVDFRLSFSPSTSALPPGLLRSELEERANEVLNQDRLQGLFDLLHGLVLTHKLNILKNQAFEMARTYWTEHLVVEPVRRSVVVQYWSNRPGGKNWVEVGVRQGDEKRVASTETSERLSSIGVRSFRGGKEVHGIEVDLRLGNLSMESILKQIIARHSSDLYSEISNQVREGILYASECLKVTSRASSIEPTDASLLVQLSATKAVKIVQEPISGRFAFLPASQLNRSAENEFNRSGSSAKDATTMLARHRSFVAIDEVEATAREIDWEVIRSISLNEEEISKHFPQGSLHPRFFRRQQWGSSWILAFITSSKGDSWWVVQLEDKPSESDEPKSQASSRVLKAAYHVSSAVKQSLVFPSSNQALTQVEWTAVGMISQYNDARKMANEIRHSIQSSNTGAPILMMTMHIPNSMLSPAERNPAPPPLSKNNDNTESYETVRLLYKGVEATTKSAVHVAFARVNKRIARLRDIVSKIPNLDVDRLPINAATIDPEPVVVDVFKFMLWSKVGESCIPKLTSRLVAIERLMEYIAVLETSNLYINSASLSQIIFTYASIPRILKATIELSADGPLRLSFPPRSPHLRIRDYLTLVLSQSSLESVIALLKLTLPILNAFSAIEKSHGRNDVSILARSEQEFEVRNSSPLPKGGFNITARLRRDEPYWFIKESSIKKTEPTEDEEGWAQSLKAVTRGKGKGWRGMKGGIVAQPLGGIADALSKLDEVFRNATVASPSDQKSAKRKAENQVVEID